VTADRLGFEVQIDALGRGDSPPGKVIDKKFRTTGALYNIPDQNLDESVKARGPGEWNEYRIRVQGNRFTVFLNNKQKTDFVNQDANRGKPDPAFCFIGLQAHTGRVRFCNIEIQRLTAEPQLIGWAYYGSRQAETGPWAVRNFSPLPGDRSPRLGDRVTATPTCISASVRSN